MECRDIDPGIAQRAAEIADEARLVLVAHEQDVGAELGLHVDALDLDHARLVAAEERAGDRGGMASALDPDADQRLVIGLAIELGLGHAAEHRRIHHIDRLGQRPEHAGQHDRGERADIELGRMALILDRDGAQALLDHLAGERAQLLGELHIRAEAGRLLGTQ